MDLTVISVILNLMAAGLNAGIAIHNYKTKNFEWLPLNLSALFVSTFVSFYLISQL